MAAGVCGWIRKVWTRRVKITCLCIYCWSRATSLKCAPSSSSPYSTPSVKKPKPWVCLHFNTPYTHSVWFKQKLRHFDMLLTCEAVTDLWCHKATRSERPQNGALLCGILWPVGCWLFLWRPLLGLNVLSNAYIRFWVKILTSKQYLSITSMFF